MLHYSMKKDNKGRQRIPVIENRIYSDLLFQIASGRRYAQKIYDFYKQYNKKSASVISRQMNFLEKEGYLYSRIVEDKTQFPMQKIRKYFIDWEKIIKEFLNQCSSQKEKVKKEDERLDLNLKGIYSNFDYDSIDIIEEEEFVKRLEKNSYLKEYFKTFFKKMANLKTRYAIQEVFGFIIMFGNLNFIDWRKGFEKINVEKIISAEERLNANYFPEKYFEMSKEERISKKKEFDNNFMEENEKVTKNTLKRKEEIIKKEQKIQDLLKLSNVLEIIKLIPTLQIGLNEAQNQIGIKIIREHFSESQIKKVNQTLPFFEKIPIEKETEKTNSVKEGEFVEKKEPERKILLINGKLDYEEIDSKVKNANFDYSKVKYIEMFIQTKFEKDYFDFIKKIINDKEKPKDLPKKAIVVIGIKKSKKERVSLKFIGENKSQSEIRKDFRGYEIKGQKPLAQMSN